MSKIVRFCEIDISFCLSKTDECFRNAEILWSKKKKKNPLTTWKRKLLKKSLVSGAVAKEYLGFNRLKTIDVHLDLLTGK